jgi:hypothetical protein
MQPAAGRVGIERNGPGAPAAARSGAPRAMAAHFGRPGALRARAPHGAGHRERLPMLAGGGHRQALANLRRKRGGESEKAECQKGRAAHGGDGMSRKRARSRAG